MSKEKQVVKQVEKIRGTGRRKTSLAVAQLNPGPGRIWVNGRNVDEYFSGRPVLLKKVWMPFEVTGLKGRYDAIVDSSGGGVVGQAGAVSLGISRALLEINVELRGTLRKAGLLTRDPRMKERKKYGQKRARKRFQYTKR